MDWQARGRARVSPLPSRAESELTLVQKTRGTCRSLVWSVRVSLDLRAVGHRTGEVITWVWIGTHNEFDNLFG